MTKENAICRLCCNPVTQPFRQFDERGHVKAGCIAADHNGHVKDAWHMRTVARTLRKNLRVLAQGGSK